MLEEADKSCSAHRFAGRGDERARQARRRTDHVPRVPFDLSALIVELASSMHEGEDRGVRLETRVPGPVMVTGDRTRLAAAIGALMHAALRERGEPGVIVVECSTLSDTNQTWAIVTIGDETAAQPLADAARATPPPVRRMARRSRTRAAGRTPRDRGAWRCAVVGARRQGARGLRPATPCSRVDTNKGRELNGDSGWTQAPASRGTWNGNGPAAPDDRRRR